MSDPLQIPVDRRYDNGHTSLVKLRDKPNAQEYRRKGRGFWTCVEPPDTGVGAAWLHICSHVGPYTTSVPDENLGALFLIARLHGCMIVFPPRSGYPK